MEYVDRYCNALPVCVITTSVSGTAVFLDVFVVALFNIPLCLLMGSMAEFCPLFYLFFTWKTYNYMLILRSWQLSLPQRLCSKRLARLTFIFGMVVLAF